MANLIATRRFIRPDFTQDGTIASVLGPPAYDASSSWPAIQGFINSVRPLESPGRRMDVLRAYPATLRGLIISDATNTWPAIEAQMDAVEVRKRPQRLSGDWRHLDSYAATFTAPGFNPAHWPAIQEFTDSQRMADARQRLDVFRSSRPTLQGVYTADARADVWPAQESFWSRGRRVSQCRGEWLGLDSFVAILGSAPSFNAAYWPSIEAQTDSTETRRRQTRWPSLWTDDGLGEQTAAASQYWPSQESFWNPARWRKPSLNDWLELDSYLATFTAPAFNTAYWPTQETFWPTRRVVKAPGVGWLFDALYPTLPGSFYVSAMWPALEFGQSSFRTRQGGWRPRPNAYEPADWIFNAIPPPSPYTTAMWSAIEFLASSKRAAERHGYPSQWKDDGVIANYIATKVYGPTLIPWWPARAGNWKHRPNAYQPEDWIFKTLAAPYSTAMWPAIQFAASSYRSLPRSQRVGNAWLDDGVAGQWAALKKTWIALEPWWWPTTRVIRWPGTWEPVDAFAPNLPVPSIYGPEMWAALEFHLASFRAPGLLRLPREFWFYEIFEPTTGPVPLGPSGPPQGISLYPGRIVTDIYGARPSLSRYPDRLIIDLYPEPEA